MTVAFGQLRHWRADAVAECARAVRADGARLSALGRALSAGPVLVGAWQGGAARSADVGRLTILGEYGAATAGVAATAAALDQAAEQVAAIVRLVHAADEVARTHGLVINDDGVPVEVPTLSIPTDPVVAQTLSLARERARWEIRDDVEHLAERATQVDAALRQALVGAVGGEAAASGATAASVSTPADLTIPPGLGGPGWSPWDSAAWWALLLPAERDRVVTDRPDLVGPRDGLPATVRDRANRVLLDRAEAQLGFAEAGLHPPRSVPPLLPSTAVGEAGRVAAMLASVRAVKAVLARDDGRTRQLLLLDTSARIAKAAVSVGDVDRAGHVAVFVGGLTTTVQGDVGRYDTSMGELTDLAERQSRTSGDGRAVAAVTWMGYEAPQWTDLASPTRSVLVRRAAETGAPLLAGFANGLDASRSAGQQPHLTVWAHSYGSPTAGLALAGTNTGVDDLAVFGSPGLGVTSLTQLHLPPGRLHVLEADDDVVADSARFGRDPDHLPGADRLSTSQVTLPDGTSGSRSAGHSEYLKLGSTSAWNLAAVAAGTPQLLVRGGQCGEFAAPTDLSCRLVEG